MPNPVTPVPFRGERPQGLFGLHNFHLVIAVLAAIVLAFAIWIRPHSFPDPVTPESAAEQMFVVGVGALIYLAIQAIAIIGQPYGSERRILLDMFFSALPLLVVIYAGLDASRGVLQLSVFEKMMLGLVALATVIDVSLFTWFALRIMRR